jgi:periplasmic protein TonB
MSTPERSTNPLALASLLIGAAGLPFGGLLGFGAVAAIGLGIAALTKYSGRPGAELAWAGILTSVLSLAAGVPLFATWGALDKQGALTGLFDDEPPPTPVTPTDRELQEPNAVAAQPPPPPPPPPPTTQAQATPLPRIEPRPSERPGRARVEGGVPGGVVGGVVGGVSDAPAPPPSGPIRVGGAIREPMKLHNVTPVYPDIAKQARVQGIVILEVTIGPDGTVGDVKILRGIPLLDQAAIDAVKQWRYTATLLNGVPVPVLMTVTVNFKLS